ncbi:TetR/AcrR family transcriptional regulator [Microbacterium istanbulense]|uniref:TetR family transcriptional regulator n=1 Tax=Microbacterium istanbulense TaxID=3122049 RepID=A0ABU8LP82_9MICO
MVRNDERRTRLLDAGIEVLAAAGARGLTFRAVDAQAEVPMGTASNYFTSRTALLRELGAHVFARLAPDAALVADRMHAVHDRELERTFMHDIVDRAQADRAAHLALIELRLEAARDPEFRVAFLGPMRGGLDTALRDHVDGGFPGGAGVGLALYLAMNGMLLEHLTLPGSIEAAVDAASGAGHQHDVHAVVDLLVDAIVPVV